MVAYRKQSTVFYINLYLLKLYNFSFESEIPLEVFHSRACVYSEVALLCPGVGPKPGRVPMHEKL